MKVLVIENDFITRNYLRDLFRYSGYDCTSAKNASEGLDYYSKIKPDAIICDVTMPGISGMQFLQKIRQNDNKTSIIMITSKSSEKLAIQAFRLGANDYLKKPIQDKDILPILENIGNKISLEPEHRNYGKVNSGQLEFKFKTEFGASPHIVERVMQELDYNYFPQDERVNIEIGLLELITNAIEHGNLGISYKEKAAVMEDDQLNELYKKRLQDKNLSKRLVTIDYKYTENECEWMIADEGNGFDHKKLPDPTQNENLDALNGRGIFISKVLFDSIEYLGKGNVVKVTKKRTPAS